MTELFKNIRFYVLISSVLISFLVYAIVVFLVPSGVTQLIKLQETYALLAIIYLYFTLLTTPLTQLFLSFPGRASYLISRRAIGVSAWYFAVLHASLSFWGQLGGFSGLGFLSGKYLFAISLSATALLILTLMATTSFDKMKMLLTYRWWKFLHRFVYLAGILILIHALILGTHYSDLSGTVSQITFGALAVLFFLEAIRIDKILQQRFITLPRFGVTFIFITICVVSISMFFFFPVSSANGQLSFDIHAAHKQLALQAQSLNLPSGSSVPLNSKIPGLDGDPSKRYTVSFTTVPAQVVANQDTELHFKVYDAMSGNPVSLFKILYAKNNHTIIVNSGLSYFSHVHATQVGSEFVLTTQFPKDDTYHIYISFQPFGAIEQQVGFTLPVGTGVPEAADITDTKTIQTVGDYAISLKTPGDLVAKQMSLGQQKISFILTNTKTGKPVTTLKPYLASFGHLTMIQTTTFDFLHVHPYSLVVPAANATAGPTVDFLPIGIYGAFKPGTYRVFAEFNPDDILTTATFTVNVK